MFYFQKFLLLLLLILITACNKNLTDEEKKEMWSKAQTTGKIIENSGTVFNPAVNKELALRDAQNRLQTGGGLLGKEGIKFQGILNKKEDANNQVGMVGMPINQFLWRGALETISFMPVSSTDPFGGVIITDWYSTEENFDERCKLNIFINGSELISQNLKVTSFCQKFNNQIWINLENNLENNIKIENAILNKAKKLKLKSS